MSHGVVSFLFVSSFAIRTFKVRGFAYFVGFLFGKKLVQVGLKT